MVAVSKKKRLKWEQYSEKSIPFGYPENVKGHQVYSAITFSHLPSIQCIYKEQRLMFQMKWEHKTNCYKEEDTISTVYSIN